MGAVGGAEQVQQFKIAAHDAGQPSHPFADLGRLGIAEGQSQMVLPCPTSGVEGCTGDVSDQAGDCAWQHVLGVESLWKPDPHVEAAVGDVPLTHG
jgi:hypothetical protein